jgi:altronate dehydratase
MAVADFSQIGRLPAPGDNAAIAVKRLEAGTAFRFNEAAHTLSHTILEGHRFAVEPIAVGDLLLSWGLPFGRALRRIEPGEYLCNTGILEALAMRHVGFALPPAPNFADHAADFRLDESSFRPGIQLAPYPRPGTFDGYARPGGRGTGSRNFILILGTTSRTGSFARELEARLKPAAAAVPGIDGIVAVAHTEGGGRRPNNLELLLRTLAGFIVHPNVAAVLAIDYGSESLTNAMLERYLREHGYPLDHVMHRFYSIRRGLGPALAECETIVRGWIDPAAAMQRTARPLADLRIALQCGGSDAFSGVSGNPLAGRVARELIRHGGAASLAETDELIGAEPYMLANVRDAATARRFLQKIAHFRERVAWHGQVAEGNPSGGNKFRGLYNLPIKSIGAARKKDPDVRLDYVIDYGEPMSAPGFYFMDSPGNDLESIAGQVASGCNLIFFITGNGSITNFPFVPTVKIVTTTGRWNLLSADMDVNAGRYQDGESMEALGTETFGFALRIASGQRSAGERAGHSQVSIWRDWRQSDGSRLATLRARAAPDGQSIPVRCSAASLPRVQLRAFRTDSGCALDRIGLIVPTSLCAGQIARRIADDLNGSGFATAHGLSRFVALVHTEGCGASSGENEDHYTRTLIGHLLHPFVRHALLLEHGCERTHNDLMRHVLREQGVEPERFGYASIQLDGGIDKVGARVKAWFAERIGNGPPGEPVDAGLEDVAIGLLSFGPVSDPVAAAMAEIAAALAADGGTVVIPENASLLASTAFLNATGWREAPRPSLDYGQRAAVPGLHVMAAPTDHAVETITGLGATGTQIMLAHVAGPPLQGHPTIPLLQAATKGDAGMDDVDCTLDPGLGPDQVRERLCELLCATAARHHEPAARARHNIDFQVTRGLLGVSL